MQGDVYEIYLDDGTKIASYAYDAWGNFVTTYHTSTTLLKYLADEAPFRYRGYYYDSETGFYYLNTRYYDPAICRFINADDISYLGANGDLQAYNLYAYCSNNPVMHIDPTGESLWDFLKNFFQNIWLSTEAEVTVTSRGIGKDNAFEVRESDVIIQDDGDFYVGNQLAAEVSFGAVTVSHTITNHTDSLSNRGENIHAHSVNSYVNEIQEMLTCEKCIDTTEISFGPVSVTKNSICIGVKSSFHAIFGGSASGKLNITELLNRWWEDLCK